MQRRSIIGSLAGAVATVVVAVLGVTTVPAAAAEPVTVVSTGFEDGTAGPWGPRGDVRLDVVDDEAATGSRSLAVTGRTADWQGVSAGATALGLVPGTTYDVTAAVKLPAGTAGSSGIHFTAEQTAPDGTSTYTWIGSAVETDADGWVGIGGSWTFPEGLASVNVYIEAAPIDGAHPPFLVDDIEITAEDGAGGGGGGTVLETGFEDGLDGWVLRAGSGATTAVVESTDALANSGARSAVVRERTSQGDGLGIDVSGRLDRAVTYELRAWVRFGEGQQVDDVWLSRADTSGATTTFATLAQFTGVTDDGWTEVVARFQGSDAATSLLYFETRYDGGAVGNTSDLYVDDVVLRVPEPPQIEDLPPIKDSLDVPAGVAIDSRETAGAASELLLRHFDQVTPENFMKPEAWYGPDGAFVETNAESDALMDFASENGLDAYGHVLVWHSQTPAFFFRDADGAPLAADEAGRAVLRERLRAHIDAVAAYLAERSGPFGSPTNPLTAIDVVNEVISDGSEYADGMRRSEWYRILGEEFVDLAFRYADEAFNGTYAAEGVDRPVALFINDYNTEQSGKQQRYRALVERLLERGVPIDGVGHQFHVSLAMPVSALEQAIVAFRDLPVVQAVTELDVTTGTPVTDAKLIDQGYYYRDAFRVFREYVDELFCVTVWGLTDGRSWRASSGAPLLFDDALRAKPAYYGVVDAPLPPPQRTADVFASDLPLADALASDEWERLPLVAVEDLARFQLRWSDGRLLAYVEVDDAAPDASDAVEFSLGDDVVRIARDGSGGAPADVVERDGGWTAAVELPLEAAAAGDTRGFDLRVVDGERTAGWNAPGVLGTLTLVEPLSYLEVVRADAAPAVDGVVDPVWSSANVVTTGRQVQGSGGAGADVRTLWSGDTLHVLANVADPVVDVSGTDPWIQDSVEVYVDPGNAKNGSYRYDDTQIRVSAANAVSFGTGDEAFQRARVTSATALVDGGYVVELAIDLGDAAGAGTVHGFDVQVNDAAGGQRSSIRNWADPTGLGYQSTARWGVARFVAPATPDAVRNVTPPSISGEVRAGRLLTASPGSWDPADAVLAFQWQRDGVDIAGATSPTYRVRGGDRGHELRVVVTATAEGREPASAASTPVVVPEQSRTTIDLDRLLVLGRGAVTADVRVSSEASVAGGTVRLIVDGRATGATATLDERGRAKLTVPRLGWGVHLVQAEFTGAAGAEPSTSGPALLLVLR